MWLTPPPAAGPQARASRALASATIPDTLPDITAAGDGMGAAGVGKASLGTEADGAAATGRPYFDERVWMGRVEERTVGLEERCETAVGRDASILLLIPVTP